MINPVTVYIYNIFILSMHLAKLFKEVLLNITILPYNKRFKLDDKMSSVNVN